MRLFCLQIMKNLPFNIIDNMGPLKPFIGTGLTSTFTAYM